MYKTNPQTQTEERIGNPVRSMGEGASPAVIVPRSTAASSRLHSLLSQLESPDSNPNSSSNSTFELDESDVVWSSDDRSTSPPSSTSSPVLTSPFPLQSRPSQPFIPATFGLSALLEPSAYSPGTGQGLIWRQSSPVTPPVSMTVHKPSAPVQYNQSAPMAVPVWPKRERRSWKVEAVEELWGEEETGEDNGEDGMEGMVVPPHVIVARSHVSSFSVLEGAGRTLKGRDLRRVRNAVLERTGFLD